MVEEKQPEQHNEHPCVAIIGAGFAGLAAAKALADTQARIVLIDRRNHHIFQPLLYQVATAVLSPSQIAQPTRLILRKQQNCTTALAEVSGIDPDKKIIYGPKGNLTYDYLVVATGATHTYFGHDEWASYAPGLKSIEDALALRGRLLDAFEEAEISEDPKEQEALLTFIIVGGGPTGVEMAGAIAELARHTLPGEFRRIQPDTAKVLLIEAGPKVLAPFPDDLSQRALKDLEDLGVEVRTGQAVTNCSAEGVYIGKNFIPARTIIWSAGVKASPAAQWLKAERDRAGRVLVKPDLSVPGYENIFVIGDTSHIIDKNGITVPGLAPAAEQQGQYVARLIKSRLENTPAPPEAFCYKDHGIMATIGRGKAVGQIGSWKVTGRIAWALWGLVHLVPLVGFRNRMIVAGDWMRAYFTKARSVRLITISKNDNACKSSEYSGQSCH